MNRKYPVFQISGCINCGICVQACPVSCLSLSIIAMQGKYMNRFPELTSNKCLGCGICASSCPMDCICMVEGCD